ncbi:MAG TPA: cytochrome d ubiquinol oxidase subunit II [Streptosporangiaceae bacterium]|nr:cytochrome d ubiquinol oxidase subunit II [Streptosporangiaceae bacterium]
MIAAAVGAILLATITLYAILGGADFGGGLWDLLAGGDRRGQAPRQLIDSSITPVWEANHVWLVFALVIFWTAFPEAFAAVMNATALPIWLAVGGIVLRGAGFAFRKEARGITLQRGLGATFAFSSLLTPFFMGTVIGAMAAGQVPADATRASLTAWTGATSLLTGFLFVGACGYLAATYLIGEAARRDDRRLEAYFTRRALAAGVACGALSLAILADLHGSDPALFRQLTGRALPLVIIAAVAGLADVALLVAGRPRGIRVLAPLGVAAVIWGWGVAQYPALLPGTPVTLSNAGAPHATLVALVVLFVALVLIVGPSFGLLFALQGRQALRHEGGGIALASASGARRSAGPATRPGESPERAGPGSRAVALGLVAVGALVRALTRRHAR